MADHQKLNIKHIDYNRNGVSGQGFHTVLFDDISKGYTSTNMFATVFPEVGHVAVVCMDIMTNDDLNHNCLNHWRGDVYEVALRKAIADQEK